MTEHPQDQNEAAGGASDVDRRVMPPAHYESSSRTITHCQADCDGDCVWAGCPQVRDNEPRTTGRHCPLDDGAEPD